MDNPLAFVWHLVSNVRATPRNFIGETLGVTSTPALLTTITGLVAMSLLAGLLLSILIQPRTAMAKAAHYLRRLVRGSAENRIVLTLILLTLLATLIPVVVIFPRVHYLVFPSAVLVVGLVVLQAKIGSSRHTTLLPVSAVLTLFLLFSVQTYVATLERVLNPPVLASTAQALAANDTAWRLLGVDSGLEVYVPNLHQIFDVDPAGVESFPSLLDREGINAVLVNTRLELADWSELNQFDLFIEDPSTYGFSQIVPGSPVWVRNTP